jgi:hypothetical protein
MSVVIRMPPPCRSAISIRFEFTFIRVLVSRYSDRSLRWYSQLLRALALRFEKFQQLYMVSARNRTLLVIGPRTIQV